MPPIFIPVGAIKLRILNLEIFETRFPFFMFSFESKKHGVITRLSRATAQDRRAATGSQFGLGAAWVGALYGITAWTNSARSKLQTTIQSVEEL